MQQTISQKQFNEKTAILFVNFGAPKNSKDIFSFLVELFSDVIKLPLFLNYIFAYLIAITRLFMVKNKYKAINDNSPLYSATVKECQQLHKNIDESKYKIFIAMLYGTPSIETALKEINNIFIKNVIVIPMFPHYSKLTTGSVFDKINKLNFKFNYNINLKFIKEFHENHEYINSWTNSIKPLISEDKVLVFSAHSTLEKEVLNGDPYKTQVENSVKLIIAKLNSNIPYYISYQSKIGPVRWLKPTTEETIIKLAKENKSVILIPLSFMTENLETLYDNDILHKELYYKNGGPNFERVPVISNYFKIFISFLK